MGGRKSRDILWPKRVRLGESHAQSSREPGKKGKKDVSLHRGSKTHPQNGMIGSLTCPQ